VEPELLDRYAELIVGFGANVQRGQIVEVRAELGKEELVRRLVSAAYRRGARFVDVNLFDPYIRKARVEHAEDIDFVPSWHRERVLELGRQRCARIALSGVSVPGMLDGLDPDRAARDHFPFIPEYIRVINDGTTNWTGSPCPTPAWASLVHPELEPEVALERLWKQVLHVTRVDEEDPVAVWESRLHALERSAERLTERRFDALHFEGPGTDLTVGLLPSSLWNGGFSETADGIRHVSNLPTEEVFTAPDPARVEGTVTATKPLQLRSGTTVTGLVVRFEGGRTVRIDAETGAEALESMCASDDGAARLGEVALVDREGRIGALETIFYDTLLDENSASHIALGSAYVDTVGEEDRERINDSEIHVDFMIGSDDVEVTGITHEGERVPVLRGGSWQL